MAEAANATDDEEASLNLQLKAKAAAKAELQELPIVLSATLDLHEKPIGLHSTASTRRNVSE